MSMTIDDHATGIVAAAHDTATKPWYLSKKVLATGVAFGLAAYSSLTGKEATGEIAVLSQIAHTATLVGPVMLYVLAQAHVDAAKMNAAGAMVQMFEQADQPDPIQGK